METYLIFHIPSGRNCGNVQAVGKYDALIRFAGNNGYSVIRTYDHRGVTAMETYDDRNGYLNFGAIHA